MNASDSSSDPPPLAAWSGLEKGIVIVFALVVAYAAYVLATTDIPPITASMPAR